MEKKLFFSIMLVLTLILASQQATARSNNLIKNPSFEEETGGKPNSWDTTAYKNDLTITEFNLERGPGHSGEKYVVIINKSENDARYSQRIKVKPDNMYRLSCWIKTENVGLNNKGANLSIANKLEMSKEIKGTNGKWEYVELYVKTGNGIDAINATVGLGGYCSINTGKASFDDVCMEEVDTIPDNAIVAVIGSPESSRIAPNNEKRVSDSGKIIPVMLIITVLLVTTGVIISYISRL